MRHKTGIAIVAAVMSGSAIVFGQGGRGQGPGAPPPPARTAAPIDLTGYWVSVVSEDWRWRMVTPAVGDVASLPINAEAKKIADAWDPAKDEAAGEQCKSYGAPALIRVPGRVHITWQDDNTLKAEFDAGTQTRLFHFGDWKAPGGEPTWQGDSVAAWETPRAQRGAGVDATIGGQPTSTSAAGTPAGRGGRAAEAARGRGPAAPRFGSLKVTTTHLRPGYLRKNGIPYSAGATLTEYWDLMKGPDNTQWLVVTSLVDDSKYLTTQLILSTNFKKEADGSKWDPTSCSARW